MTDTMHIQTQFAPGDFVKVTKRSDAMLQLGSIGVVLDATGSQRQSQIAEIRNGSWLLVDLQPDRDGLYGGRYWFPPDDLAPLGG